MNASPTAVQEYLLNLQNKLCKAIEVLDGRAGFQEDFWQHTEGGFGKTRTLANGAVFEKGGINFSHVKGIQLPEAATTLRPALRGAPFEAMGISIIMHPTNPYVPTMHANVRFIIVYPQDQAPYWWFGGGFDLTPYYGFEEDAQTWHQNAFEACKLFNPNWYTEFKNNCDSYFYLKHRQETRGVGGLFFDDFTRGGFKSAFAFMQSVGDHISLGYLPIVHKRLSHAYTQHERDFQLYRRGRYVEFNLLYDRGTLFGLQSGGRTESILVSLPPLVRWEYNYQPQPGSSEAKLYSLFLKPQNWLEWSSISNE